MAKAQTFIIFDPAGFGEQLGEVFGALGPIGWIIAFGIILLIAYSVGRS